MAGRTSTSSVETLSRPSLSEELAHAIPGCEVVVVPEGGHMVDFEKASESFEIVNDFIERHQ
jgi:pimeloyl-ACP methyl ester carboxylesterase